MREKFPQKPPAYEAAGKIKAPRSDDAVAFSSALKVLKEFKEKLSSDSDLDLALDLLLDLSNDIYYGVEITKDSDILWILFALMYSHDPGKPTQIPKFPGSSPESPPQRRRQAAAILSHAIQNNPTALSQFSQEVTWMEHLCVLIDGESDAGPMKSKIKALSHILKDAQLRRDFLHRPNGTRILLAAFLRQGAAWEGVRSVIAELLLDNYVDEDMGAQTGLWPVEAVAGDARRCGDAAHELDDACWEFHLAGSKDGNVVAARLLIALQAGRPERETLRHGEL